VRLHDGGSHTKGLGRRAKALAVEQSEGGKLALVVSVGHGALSRRLAGRLVVVEPHARVSRQSVYLDPSGDRKKVDQFRNFNIEGEAFNKNLYFRTDSWCIRITLKSAAPAPTDAAAPATTEAAAAPKSRHCVVEVLLRV
jgi:hypothetical protein